ncbi:MAG: bifunctional transcriptional activator/DNA repair protein Ada [Ignavibacteria bacterium]|nr:bifunctional transcriptional activator/DNA repair protein Ada [Ignavibacteria bacterium]
MNTQHALPTDRGDMLRALMDRDRSFDGLFFAGITTTMIFCRPSCPAKKPKEEHVEFYATAREALFAGFRPCRRCHPLQDGQREPEWVARLVERVEADPSRRIRDAELREEGLDPAAVRRHFQKSHGMTFQAYCRARRLGNAFTAIRNGERIDDAVYGSGWESHSGFREAFAKAAELPPGAARDSDFIRLAWIDTPLGPMAAAATEEALCMLEFTDRRMLEAQLETLKRRFRMPLLPGESPLFEQLRMELSEYFDGRRESFDVPIEYPGTDFQRKVWEGLLRIPFGETRTYAALAASLGIPGAARAVGHANGLNRIAILIPCHRVINADGGLGGYGGGLWRKLRLLETERGNG